MFSGSDSAKNHFKCSVDQMSGKPLYGDKKIIIRRMRVRRFGLGRLELADFFIVERERLWINYCNILVCRKH